MKFPSFQHRVTFSASFCMFFLAALVMVQCAAAGSSKSSSSKPAPAKSTPAPAKSSSGGGTAGHSGGTGTAGHPGATTSGHSGPSANSPSTHSGPSANGSGAAHTGPSANSPSTHSGPTAAGGAHGGPSAGTANHTASGGHMPAGAHTVNTAHGAVTRRPDGHLRDVHDSRRGMDVHHGLNGGRRISVERADHSRIMAERGRRGFIERPYSFHGHDYARRSYYWHGHEYNRFYRGYYFHGAYINVYAPVVFYGPAFYGWVYNPWYTPVVYGWGWAGNPWYGYYGFYFAPAPVYATPADWLTDYAISTNLQAAYAAQQEAHTAAVTEPSAGQPALTPEIKQQIADEVRAQIALENNEAQLNSQGQEPDPNSSSINRMFADGRPHVFMANTALDVVDASGAECALSDGDVIRTTTAPDANATEAAMLVVASKGGNECHTSSTVMVAVSDLQEMQNGLRENVDQGMAELQSNQGKKGLPAAPASAQAAPVQTAFAQAAPPPETNGAAEVNQQLVMADQVDQDATQGAPVGVDAGVATTVPAATVNIAVGQTIEQVTAAMGPPKTVVNLGPKKIYKYPDLSVVFMNGKVSDVK